jgi:hypothetical protein
MPRKVKDISGRKFNKLTAIRCVGVKKTGDGRSEAVWLWQCDCGNQITAQARHVKYKDHRNAKQSCGCWHKTKKNFGVKAVANRVFLGHYHDGDLKLDDFLELSQQSCYYCGSQPSNVARNARAKHIEFRYNGLDRLDNTEPHNRENCVPCCWMCNQCKSNLPLPEFMNWIENIYFNRCLPENFNV